MEFIRKEASKKSINMRKPLYGVGINDSKYVISKMIDGKMRLCPIYRVWANMLTRCYREEYSREFPTYKDCTVCDEWLLFSNFAEWAEDKIKDGYDLDKDIIKIGNKIYSPDACVFLPKAINYLISGAKRNSKYKTGVHFCKRDKVFRASMSIDSKTTALGTYRDEDFAHKAYVKAKYERLIYMSSKVEDKDIGKLIKTYADNALISKPL